VSGNPKETCPECGRQNVEGQYWNLGAFSGTKPGGPLPKSAPMWRFTCPTCKHEWESVGKQG